MNFNPDAHTANVARAYAAAYRNASAHDAMRLAALGMDRMFVAGPPLVTPNLAGLIPSDDDVRDYVYVPSGRFPLTEMDMRAECSPIRDQGQVGSCTAFQVDGHCGRYAKRAGMPTLAYSTRANYAMSRQLLGYHGDTGATLRAAIHAAYKYGMPTEADFPYGNDPAAVINTTELPAPLMLAAAGNKIDHYYRLDTPRMTDWPEGWGRLIDHALADGYTVGWGGFVHRWFFYLRGPLSTHAAVRNDPAIINAGGGDVAGGHAMVIVGRSDSLGGYIVRNSWGTEWGDNGYGLLLFSDIMAEGFEFWAVAGFDGSDVRADPIDPDSDPAKVGRLYRAAFNRYPDAGGYIYQRTRMALVGHMRVALDFISSPEYQRIYGGAVSDEQYVRALYVNALRRAPDMDGLQFHLQELAAGMPRAQMLINFAESPESRGML